KESVSKQGSLPSGQAVTDVNVKTSLPVQPPEEANPTVVVASETKEGTVAGLEKFTFVGAAADTDVTKIDQPALQQSVPVFQTANRELDRAFADVKKFELTVQPEVLTPPHTGAGQQASGPQDPLSKTALVTTDPVKNLTQQQLPPTIMPVLKV